MLKLGQNLLRRTSNMLCVRYLNTNKTGAHLIAWIHSLTEGVQLAKKENKPIMLFVHRPWCNACKKLLPIVKENADVRAMNTKFVLVELTGEDEKTEEEYAPDGAYVPRIVFLSSEGKVMKITNPSNFSGTNMYTYQSAEDLVSAMKQAIG